MGVANARDDAPKATTAAVIVPRINERIVLAPLTQQEENPLIGLESRYGQRRERDRSVVF
jgi:hypothetical protein